METIHRHAVVISALWAIVQSANLEFPPGFKFGVSTSSYQIEGGWNASDKTPSLWDHLVHERPELFPEGHTGDVACDSYHRWKQDLAIITDLGLDHYRFSISWARLFPNGNINQTSLEGFRYYSNMIDSLLDKGVEPIVTMYHWETPIELVNLGGWTNPKMSDWFANYTRKVFQLFGDRVKTWLTMNEPLMVCDVGYGTGIDHVNNMSMETAMYLCNKHMVLGHAKAYRIYDNEFRSTQKGRVSLSSQMFWFQPKKPQHENITELVRLNMARSFHPIFSKEGDWHPGLNKALSFKLLPFTQEEVKLIRGTYDFFGLNYYTSRLVRVTLPRERQHHLEWPMSGCPEINAVYEHDHSWHKTDANYWYYSYPEGLRKLMGWITKTYGNMGILITENGFPTLSDSILDEERTHSYREHLKQVLMAMNVDKVKVLGFTAWALMDNFEWLDAFRCRFGLYKVDFDKPDRPRTARDSALFYKSVIASRSLDVPDPSHPHTTTIIASTVTVIIIVIISFFIWRYYRKNKGNSDRKVKNHQKINKTEIQTVSLKTDDPGLTPILVLS